MSLYTQINLTHLGAYDKEVKDKAYVPPSLPLSHTHSLWIPWPSGRDEDSRSMGPGFKSRRSANFQRLCRTFEIGIHMRRRLPSVNGELRGNVTLVAH